MFKDPCETRVFGDSCVGRGEERLVCYGNRVLLARSCVQRVREHVATVYSSFIECTDGGTERFAFSEFELLQRLLRHSVCTDR